MQGPTRKVGARANTFNRKNQPAILGYDARSSSERTGFEHLPSDIPNLDAKLGGDEVISDFTRVGVVSTHDEAITDDHACTVD